MFLRRITQVAKLSIALAGVLAQPAAAANAADAFVLVRDGAPQATIVVTPNTVYEREAAEKRELIPERVRAKNPKATEKRLAALIKREQTNLEKSLKKNLDEERLAAEELQTIIEKISGAKLPIVQAAPDKVPDGSVILIGDELARARGLGKELDAMDRDGILLRSEGKSLVLSGRRSRGTLFAVYDFLESLGCRWVMPGPFGEIYPTSKTISTTIDKKQDPSHTERYFWCTYGQGKGYQRWTLRNKGNFVRAPGDAKVAQGHALSAPLRWGAASAKYGQDAMVMKRVREKGPDGKPKMVRKEVKGRLLPEEYYARANGKARHSAPNMSNPKVWDLYAEYYIEHFNKKPEAQYVSISAEDGITRDERPASRLLDSYEVDSFLGAYAATDRMWFFHNRVIEKVIKVHPDKKFGVLVYSNNMSPPRIERVHPNMALVFAPLGISPLHHVRDPKSKTNRGYHKWFKAWMAQAKAVGAETYYYDYEPMGFCWNLAMICPRWGIIGKNYPWFHELGLDGHTTQGHDDWASQGLDNWVMQRLYWDVTQDYREIIADYARARFGAAAPAMIEYYQILEDRMGEITDLYSNEVWDNHLILTPEVRRQCREKLAKAMKMAKTERSKAHLETMADLQRSTDAFCDAVEHARVTADFGAAAKMMETCFEVRDKLNQLYSHFMQPKRTSEKSRAQYLTGGYYNQYLGFDAKIKAAKASLALPQMWKVALDTGNTAWAKGWQRPEVSVAHLEDHDVTVCPDVKYQTQREVAGFFYRTDVVVPKAFAKREKIELFFPSVIARALQIWVNGERVMFDHGDYKDATWRGPLYFWQKYDHQQSFDITPHVKPGQKNTIAFRVFKSFDFGGTYRRPYLLADPAEVKK